MDSTSLTLLERLRTASDDSAWRRFVDLYTPLLQLWARRAGLSEADAADVKLRRTERVNANIVNPSSIRK